MGKIVKKNQPCTNPNCGSSDAMMVYEDGGTFCFSCRTPGKGEVPKISKDEFDEVETEVVGEKKGAYLAKKMSEIKEYGIRGFKERNIRKEICEHYGVKVSYTSDGEIEAHYYPYGPADEPTGYKIRHLPKEFEVLGKQKGLFGFDLFTGGGKRVIITEGEIDCLTVAQISYDKYKKFYPVIGLASAALTNELVKARDWLRSFQEVILCFDMDKAGEDATAEAIKIIGIDKVKVVKLPNKDANETFMKLGGSRLQQALWDAQPYRPAGIIGKEELWKALVEYNEEKSVPYPDCLRGLNSKIKGMRLAEIALYISGTGSGKSSLIREIIAHLVETLPKEEKIGAVFLEDAPGETARLFAALGVNRNSSDEDITLEELRPGFDAMFGEDRIVVLDHQGTIKDNSIISQLEYMCLVGCKYLFVDHITILVSEGMNDLTGNELIDAIMNELLRLVKRHNVHIGLVSHLRKVPGGKKSFEEGQMPTLDDIRGSGSIKQVSFDVIAFARNMAAEDEEESKHVKMAVLKSRKTGKTGPVSGVYYVEETGRFISAEDAMISI